MSLSSPHFERVVQAMGQSLQEEDDFGQLFFSLNQPVA